MKLPEWHPEAAKNAARGGRTDFQKLLSTIAQLSLMATFRGQGHSFIYSFINSKSPLEF